jgi:hypothetical protein
MPRDSIAPSWQGLRIVILQEFDELFAEMKNSRSSGSEAAWWILRNNS